MLDVIIIYADEIGAILNRKQLSWSRDQLAKKMMI